MTDSQSIDPPLPAGKPSALSLWMMAVRPRTLSMSLSPVAVGACLSWRDTGGMNWLAVAAAFLGAIFIQAGTNLHNDAADFERGGDGPDRLGPPRVSALGLLPSGQVKRAALLSFALAALCGLTLISIGGWSILAVGILSILAGLAYSSGPMPISHTPLGEIFVVLFFGLAAVGGTYFLNAGTLSWAACDAGIAIGLFAAAVLLVNNHRDAVSDARSGRRTLAILAGPRLTLIFYATFILLPFILLPLFGTSLQDHPWWLAYGGLPFTIILARSFAREPRGPGFNRILVRTAQLQLGYSVLLCLGLTL